MPTPTTLWRRWLGPVPGRKEARAMSVMALIAGAVLCCLSLIRGFHGETFMGRPLGGDFVQFYVAGQILNQYDAARLYDLSLAVSLQHAALPSMPQTQMLVFGHGPYIAELFRPFALLPYEWAYVAWLVFSAALYVSAVLLLFRSLQLPAEARRIGLLLAASSMPFLLETWIGGQISVLVMAVWAAFLCFHNARRPFIAGAILALAIFKPTLVLLPLAMLLIGARWRVLAGFATGLASLAIASLRPIGLAGWQAWLHTLLFDSKITMSAASAARRYKNVDVNSFFHLLFGDHSLLPSIAAGLAAALAITPLALAWWRTRKQPAESNRNALWAATLSLTLLLNPYAPIYDAVLLVPVAALAYAGLPKSRPDLRETFAIWLVLLYMIPWITQSFAEFLHLQLLTPLVAAFGLWMLKSSSGFPEIPNRAQATSHSHEAPQDQLFPVER